MLASVDLERKVQILTRLTEINTDLSSTIRLKPLLQTMMDAAAEVTDSEAASVLLWDTKTDDLRFAATTANPSGHDLIGKPIPLEGSIAGTVLRENRIVAVENVSSDPRHYNKLDKAIAFQTRSVLAVPLKVKDRVIGVLEAVNKRRPPWTANDQQYTSILAAQAAIAIDNAQLVAQLQKANEELSRLDKLKNDFIALASHELRTPLGVILGYASFLQEEQDGLVSEHATKVVNSALQLRHIIEQLTNLRYLHSSEVELHRERIDLTDLLRDLEHDIRSLAEAKQHRVHFSVPANTYVYVDRIRMVMALTNVLNNAVRFTPDGGRITVKAELRPPVALVSIADTGMGIPDDQLERIFTEFYQLEDHLVRRHGGLGIGLSIARAVINAHGGEISAASPGLNQGAVFRISLPLADGLA